MKKDSILYVVAFTFVVCAFFVLGLALANESTKDLVEANREFASQAAVLDALGIAWTDRSQAAIQYSQQVSPVEGSVPPAYRATVDGSEFIAVEHTGAGLWGGITIILAANPEATRIRGIQIVAQNETPGLGGRIEEAWFLNQFKGEKVPDQKIRIAVGAESKGTGDTDPENSLADGVTGASRTSQSFEFIINDALSRVKAVAGGGK
jgi:Na+-transporting NADH:ubiquinone oxidoreductase subunit C